MNRQPLKRNFPGLIYRLAGLLWLLLLTACGGQGGGAVLSDTPADAGQLDLRGGASALDTLNINYKIGQAAKVSASLEGPNGQHYVLRYGDERTPGDYSLRLTGAIDQLENNLNQTRLLTDGKYRYVISAVGLANGATSEASGQFSVVNSPAVRTLAPQVEGLSANPAVISPNFDARDDTSLIGWRTSQPATVTVSISNGSGLNKILHTFKNEPAQEEKTVFAGLDDKGEPLPDGLYTYMVQAADHWGNVSRRAGQVELKGGGRPTASIVQAAIGPTAVVVGGLVTVTLRVKNTGKVAIRSQGPNSGFVYSTNDVYSSIENGKYKDAAGFWRVGVDYESNSGGGPSRYPFRWGFGDELPPGQEVEVVGVIRVDRQEQQLKFYAGLIEEQVRLPQDHIQVTVVKISY